VNIKYTPYTSSTYFFPISNSIDPHCLCCHFFSHIPLPAELLVLGRTWQQKEKTVILPPFWAARLATWFAFVGGQPPTNGRKQAVFGSGPVSDKSHSV
jgi:hypothetical protein